jgi:hypothetical protein
VKFRFPKDGFVMIIKVLVLRSFSASGIRVGLKMLTVLFIGGASGSAQLLGCQRTDGAGGRFVAPNNRF